MLFGDLEGCVCGGTGKEALEGGNMFIFIADSCFCTAETNIIL